MHLRRIPKGGEPDRIRFCAPRLQVQPGDQISGTDLQRDTISEAFEMFSVKFDHCARPEMCDGQQVKISRHFNHFSTHLSHRFFGAECFPEGWPKKGFRVDLVKIIHHCYKLLIRMLSAAFPKKQQFSGIKYPFGVFLSDIFFVVFYIKPRSAIDLQDPVITPRQEIGDTFPLLGGPDPGHP